ncbi:hypothetical protein E4T39_00286 [Aureobasidium subglaciale]|nr:hypothetical protein E4T39_00286 [Aureobasidium subglaciale]
MTANVTDSIDMTLSDCGVASRLAGPGSAYHASYQRVKDLVEVFVTDFRSTFDMGYYHDQHIEAPLRLIKRITEEREPVQVVYGVTGFMGSGKSSLINAIVGHDIARKDNRSGGACTWMIQKFRREFPKQPAPFRAEITFQSDVELESFFELMFREAYTALAVNLSVESDSQDRNDEDSNQHDLRGLSHIKTIQALFPHRAECHDLDGVRGLILQAENENDMRVAKRLTALAVELVHQSKSVFDSTTAQDLLHQLTQFAHGPLKQDVYDTEPAFWPIIKEITFGLTGCALLDDGVVLMDMPGSHDRNPTQDRTTARARQHANGIISTATISRALSDDTLIKYLEQGCRAKQKVIAVVTKIDEIDDDSLATVKMTELQNRIEEVSSKRRQAKREGRAQEKEALEEEEDTLSDELRALRAAESSKPSAIEKRNDNVKRNLSRIYKNQTGQTNPLKIFPVSSKVYGEHQAGYGSFQTLRLAEAQTGIIALCNHLQHSTIRGRLNDVVFLCETQLPQLTNLVRLCPTYAYASHRQTFPEILDCAARNLEERVRDALEPIKESEKLWIKDSQAMCDVWRHRYKATKDFLALIRKGGVKPATRNTTETDCNQELRQMMSEIMHDKTEGLINIAQGLKSHMVKQFSEPLTKVENQMEADTMVALMTPTAFEDQIKLQKKALSASIDICFSTFEKRLRAVSLDINTDAEGSVVDTCMGPIYQDVLCIRGYDSGKRRPAHLRRCMTHLWTRVYEESLARYTEAVDECRQGLEKIAFDIMGDIGDSFHSFSQAKEQEDEGELELRDELLEVLARTNEVYRRELLPALAECKETMSSGALND